MLFGISTVYIWLALTVLFVVLEIATTDISSIWFAAGALASTVAAWIAPDAIAVQAVVFAAVTAVTIYFTKPILNKYLTKKVPTNMDMYIGKQAQAVSDISPQNVGRAKIGGLTWQAKSSQTIKKGEMCKIVKIEGASLVVEKI